MAVFWHSFLVLFFIVFLFYLLKSIFQVPVQKKTFEKSVQFKWYLSFPIHGLKKGRLLEFASNNHRW